MSFQEIFEKYTWTDVTEKIQKTSAQQVEAILKQTGRRSLEDFLTLVSPAAKAYLPHMKRLSQSLTMKRFGKTLQMYIPLYLSNECQNICTYCGFSLGNKIERLTLKDDQILQEAAAIKKLGYDHVLIVTGEAQKTVGVSYLKHALELLKPFFSQITMEVQPLAEEEYRELIRAGLYGVLVYQETYHKEAYATFHPKGKKANFNFRLDTPDRLGKAEIHKIGLGALLGLEDWRTDSFFVALHLRYLERAFWKTKFSISFPRLRPAEGALSPKVELDDQDLMQLICAFRIFNEDVELSLSTREMPELRNELITIGITSISAGSSTEPGGYAVHKHALKQFEVGDERSPDEVAVVAKSLGYEPVWKDWEQRW